MKIKYFELTVYPTSLFEGAKVYRFDKQADALSSITASYALRDDAQIVHGALDDVWVWDKDHPEAKDANPAVYGHWIELDVLVTPTLL